MQCPGLDALTLYRLSRSSAELYWIWQLYLSSLKSKSPQSRHALVLQIIMTSWKTDGTAFCSCHTCTFLWLQLRGVHNDLSAEWNWWFYSFYKLLPLVPLMGQICLVLYFDIQYIGVCWSRLGVLCHLVQCNAVQWSAVQCCAMQCSQMQCHALQCSTVQCSLALPITL